MFWFHNLAIAAFLESFEHRYLEYQWVMFLSVLNFPFWEQRTLYATTQVICNTHLESKGSVAVQALITYSVRALLSAN